MTEGQLTERDTRKERNAKKTVSKGQLGGGENTIKATMIKVFLLIIIIQLMMIGSCLAAALMPKQGSETKESGLLIIDYSNSSEGYIMAKTKPSDKKFKLIVNHDETELQYDLNNEGIYEVFPLQYGEGEYIFTLYELVVKPAYKKLNTISITVEMTDPNRCFLYPNQYINYTPDTPAVIFAQELCKGMENPEEIACKIFDFICYDEELYEPLTEPDGTTTERKNRKLKYGKLNGEQLPDIDTAFETSTGICKDFAGLMVAMLRSVGVPAKYVVGKYNGSEHAWVIVLANGKEIGMDPTYMKMSVTLDEYSAERWY